MAKYPTALSLRLGSYLKQHREALGLDVDAVASGVGISVRSLRRGEAGQDRPTLTHFRRLLALYGITDPTKRREAEALWADSQVKGWLADYEAAEPYRVFNLYSELEARAFQIQHYSSLYVHGLVQTERYALAILYSAPLPPDDDARTWLDIRLDQQKVILGRDPAPDIECLLDELVLHRNIGGAAVMAEQLDYLIKVAESGKIRLRIVPSGDGVWSASSSYSIMHTDLGDPVMFVSDSPISVVTDATEYRTFALSPPILSTLALSQDESLRLIRDRADHYRRILRVEE